MKLNKILFCLLLPIHMAFAYELPLPNKPHIVIEGYGAIEQVPDLIKINFEVSATAANLALAKKVVDSTVSKAIKAVRKLKVAEDQINASKIQAHPQYEWKKEGREYKGEMVNRQVEIKLTDPELYNTIVDALLAAGISRLQNVSMDFSNRELLEKKAMTLALNNAKLQAQNIAKSLDDKLGGIFQVAPLGSPVIMGALEMRASDAKKDQASGLTLGKQTVEQRVRVVYLLN